MQMLLGAVLVALVVSAAVCLLALLFFPWFRSGERKTGHFRPDQSSGEYQVNAAKGVTKVEVRRANNNELPLVGGPAIIIGIIAASIATGIWVQLSLAEWKLLGVLLLALLGFGLVGFMDDWMKVHRGVGISELQKFVGVVLVSLASAVAINRLDLPKALSAKLAYPPYSDIPWLGHFLVDTKFVWIGFFLLLTVTVASTTALAVDFADGMDGLCGGLMLSAALSFAAIILSEGFQDLWPAVIVVLAIAGACAGFLPFNWPSSWKARNQGWGKRRAKLIMGDTGSLALGGLLALVAMVSRLEFVLLFVGGVFVLEGLSALISARILVRFFRKFLYLERFQTTRGFAHTEFPLPFLATPMHHHYDLLNWDRKRLVYGAWMLGAGLGLLGVASTIAPLTWERYLARFVAFLILVAVWQAGPWTKGFFIGLEQPAGMGDETRRRLALYYGFPYRLLRRKLYRRIDITEVGEEVLANAAERLTLWQRMSVFDARSLLGYYCYRADSFDDALRVWGKLPKANLERRPEIADMLVEVRHELALRSDADLLVPRGAPANGQAGVRALAAPYDDPNATARTSLADGPEAVRRRDTLWNPTAYTDWTSSAGGGIPVPPQDIADEYTLPANPSSPKTATLAPESGESDEGDTQPGKAVPRL